MNEWIAFTFILRIYSKSNVYQQSSQQPSTQYVAQNLQQISATPANQPAQVITTQPAQLTSQKVPNEYINQDSIQRLKKMMPEYKEIVKTSSPSQVNNTEFNSKVLTENETFKKFAELNPSAMALLRKILNNYGIIPPDSVYGDNGMALPDPNKLIDSLEEGLAIHASFKGYLRGLFEVVQKYLARSSIIITETVIQLRNEKNAVMDLIKNSEETNSTLLKNQYDKQLNEHLESIQKIIAEFNRANQWRTQVVNGVSSGL
jgi:hypothetical protein